MNELTKVVEEMRKEATRAGVTNGTALNRWAERIEAAQVVDDAMVERAGRALWPRSWLTQPGRQEVRREALKAALTAALAAKESP